MTAPPAVRHAPRMPLFSSLAGYDRTLAPGRRARRHDRVGGAGAGGAGLRLDRRGVAGGRAVRRPGGAAPVRRLRQLPAPGRGADVGHRGPVGGGRGRRRHPAAATGFAASHGRPGPDHRAARPGRRAAAAGLPGQLHLRAGAQGLHHRARPDHHRRPGARSCSGSRRPTANFFEQLWGVLADLGQTSADHAAGRPGLAGPGARAAALRCRWCPARWSPSCSAIAAVWLLDLDAHGVEIVGQIDSGLPALGLPDGRPRPTTWPWPPAAAGVMLVGFAEGLGAAKTYAARAHYEVDANRELLGLGAANLGAGLSSGMVVNGSLSKTAVNGAAGARSQVSGPGRGRPHRRHPAVPDRPVREPARGHAGRRGDRRGDRAGRHPGPARASTGSATSQLRRIYGIAARPDFIAAVAALLGVLVFDTLPGLFIGIAVSLLLLLYRASRPHVAVLGQVPGRPGQYGDVERHPENLLEPGVAVLRVEARPVLRQRRHRPRRHPRPRRRPGTRAVVLDAETAPFIDVTAARMLVLLTGDLRRSGVELVIARDVGQVRDVLRRAGTDAPLPRAYPTVRDAVEAVTGPRITRPRVRRAHPSPPDAGPGDRAPILGGTMAKAVQGRDQARRPGLDPGLGRVPGRPGARGRRPTCWSCSTTTPGCAAWSPYGGRIKMPTMQRLADNGLTYSPVAHHGAVLADPLDVPDRAQPPPERVRVDLGDRRPGSPATTPTSRRENATMATVLRDAGWSTFWVGKNHNVPVDEWTMGGVEEGLAARPGLRPLLRLHRRRDQQVVSRPGRGQPLHRPAVPARGRLPPVQGPGRQGAAVHPRLQAVRAGQALVPVVLPGRQPRPPPRPAGVHRQVQGQVRRRLRGLPRMGAAPHDRAGDPARGHRADPDQPDDRGHLQRRATRCGPGTPCRTRRSGCSRRMAEVYAGFSRVHRRPGRPDRRLPGGVRASSRTR